jgi:hypothetical protein
MISIFWNTFMFISEYETGYYIVNVAKILMSIKYNK